MRMAISSRFEARTRRPRGPDAFPAVTGILAGVAVSAVFWGLLLLALALR